MRTMASKDETVPFDLEGYIGKLELLKRWAQEAERANTDPGDKARLNDIADCYQLAIDHTLEFVRGKPNAA